MSPAKSAQAIDALLTRIANEHLGIATLKTRMSDSLDFHDVSVWGVKSALTRAYRAGCATGEPMAEAMRILFASCEEALSGAWDKGDGGFEDMIEVARRALAKWEGGAP